MPRPLKVILVVVALAGWFFANAWRGLLSYFTYDDLMNLYRAWDFPLYHLAIANLTPFTKVYRPLGAVFYRVMYAIAGLHPMPFRIAIYVVLLVNIALLYWLVKLLTDCEEMGVIAALLGAYHNRIMDLYTLGGTVYDILCFTFYVAAMCVYIRARRRDGPMPWRSGALFVALNVLALNSKEMAATLPAVLLAYEIFYHRRFPKSVMLWISFAMTAIAAKIRLGVDTAFTGNEYYALNVSPRQFFLTTRLWLDDLFAIHPGSINTVKAVLILALVWAIAIALKRRELLLAAAIITVAPLPVNFIAARGFFAMYVPLIGWILYASVALVAGRDWLLEHVWHRARLPAGTWEPERVTLFVVTMYVLFNVYSQDRARSFLYDVPEQQNIRSLMDSLKRIRPSVPRGGGVLFVSNGLADRWAPLYIIRLYYGDPKITVDIEAQDRTYDEVLGLCDRGYCEVKK